MLRGIDPLLTPDLLHALASAGHGDRVGIVDANFPGRCDGAPAGARAGISATAMLEAVLSVLPVDDFIPDPVSVMQVVGDPSAMPEAVAEFTAILQRNGLAAPKRLERHGVLWCGRRRFRLVQTGERRLYGNILLTKGVIQP